LQADRSAVEEWNHIPLPVEHSMPGRFAMMLCELSLSTRQRHCAIALKDSDRSASIAQTLHRASVSVAGV
jgi:hypothetical protein